MNEQLTVLYGYLHGMWRYRWSALVITWIVALLGWLVVLAIPDKFSAKAVVYVDTSSILKPLLKGLAPETDSHDQLNIIKRVLLSRTNLMSIIRETDLDLTVSSRVEEEALLEDLVKTIKIEGGGNKKDKAYEISIISSSANRSFQIVSNLLNTMIEDTLKSTRIDTGSAQEFLDSQISRYEERLTVAEQKLAIFKKENAGYMPNERGGFFQRLQLAKDSVEKTTSALHLAERRYSELSKQIKSENPVLTSDNYQSENVKKIKDHQSQLNTLLIQYTDRHPEVLALLATIKNLKAALDTSEVSSSNTSDSNSLKEFNPVYQELKVQLNNANIEVELLKIQLKEKHAFVAKLSSSIDVIPEVEARLSKLNRGYEVTRERYLNLVERRESALLAQSAGQSSSDISFRVIDPPIAPFLPSSPRRALLLSGVLLAAFSAGLGWSYFQLLITPTFINTPQLISLTSFPILGSVSLYLSPTHRSKRRLQLSSFFLATFILLVVFGAVILLRGSGAALISSIIGEIKTGI